MDADDDARCPWLPGVRALIREAAEAGVPTLGICLGHQLAALALGGEVGRNPYGRTRGLRQVDWDPEVIFDPLVSAIAGEDRAVHWNQDVVTTLPPGAVLLASTLDGAVQAARFARTVWGVQFHPEADLAVVTGWAEHDRRSGALPDDDVDARLRDIEAAMPDLAGTWVRLAAAFARHARGRAAARELFGG
jgi:GMP synthase-like glutamine amidotransferase